VGLFDWKSRMDKFQSHVIRCIAYRVNQTTYHKWSLSSIKKYHVFLPKKGMYPQWQVPETICLSNSRVQYIMKRTTTEILRCIVLPYMWRKPDLSVWCLLVYNIRPQIPKPQCQNLILECQGKEKDASIIEYMKKKTHNRKIHMILHNMLQLTP